MICISACSIKGQTVMPGGGEILLGGALIRIKYKHIGIPLSS